MDPRQAIFDAIADARNTPLTDQERFTIDTWLDALMVHRAGSQQFAAALETVLPLQGGYASGKGRMANLGVERGEWEGWRGRKVAQADIRNLTPERVAPYYRERFWDPLNADFMDPALALCAFDFALHAGVERAALMLQVTAGLIPPEALDSDGIEPVDEGRVGTETLAALRVLVEGKGSAEAVARFQKHRREHHECEDCTAAERKAALERAATIGRAARA